MNRGGRLGGKRKFRQNTIRTKDRDIRYRCHVRGEKGDGLARGIGGREGPLLFCQVKKSWNISQEKLNKRKEGRPTKNQGARSFARFAARK